MKRQEGTRTPRREQKTPTVSASLGALIRTHHLPSTSKGPVNTCWYLPAASVWANTPVLVRPAFRRNLSSLPLDSYSFCGHAPHLLSR